MRARDTYRERTRQRLYLRGHYRLIDPKLEQIREELRAQGKRATYGEVANEYLDRSAEDHFEYPEVRAEVDKSIDDIVREWEYSRLVLRQIGKKRTVHVNEQDVRLPKYLHTSEATVNVGKMLQAAQDDPEVGTELRNHLGNRLHEQCARIADDVNQVFDTQLVARALADPDCEVGLKLKGADVVAIRLDTPGGYLPAPKGRVTADVIEDAFAIKPFARMHLLPAGEHRKFGA